MVRDNVTFRFRIDSAKAQQTIRELEASVKRLGGTMDQTGSKSTQLQSKISQTGNTAAASAINFQTATQGMLNLSTAAVQTFTSISNLDRAANRLAQSKLGVARATDLLNNKELRLTELQERGLGTSRKAGLLTNEIATARADLAVKTDKARIEEGALLDIQLLFVTNIANVMISSIQTIKTLRDLQALSTIKATLAEKAMNSSFLSSIVLSKTAAVNFKGMTFAIKGMTFSVRGLMLALGPVALVITGITVAMQAYEENWGGFKDAVQTALPFLKESNTELDNANDILENGRVDLDNYSSSIDNLGKSMNKLSTPMKNYLELMRDASLAAGNAREAARFSAQLIGVPSQGFSQPSFAGGQVVTGGISATASGAGGTGTGIPNVPTTGQSQLNSNTHIADGGGSQPNTIIADPFGTMVQQELFKLQNPVQQRESLQSLAQSELNAGRKGSAEKYALKAEGLRFAAEHYVPSPPLKTFADIMDKDAGFFAAGGKSVFAPRARTVDMTAQELRFGVDIAHRRGIDPNSNRGIVLNKTGIDIGPIGDLVDVNEGIRLANLETTLSQFRKPTPGTIGGISGGRASLAISAVGGNATQAFQIPEFGISAERRRQLDIKDANTNLLRFGGRLREGMTIEDEGAVVGGYSSVREFSAVLRARREIGWTRGKALAASFGYVMPKGYLSGQDWKTESGRLASRAKEMTNTLASAGLSFKNVGYLDFGYRASAQQVARANAEHSAAVAYNQNQYAKATQINLLEGGFDLSGFRGTSMDLPSLQNKIQEQDDLMKSIGLTRTEAFQIIDTQGRGREEIDDRLKWKSRLNRMSSGVAVL